MICTCYGIHGIEKYYYINNRYKHINSFAITNLNNHVNVKRNVFRLFFLGKMWLNLAMIHIKIVVQHDILFLTKNFDDTLTKNYF